MAKRRDYIFTNKKHSDCAIMSSLLGVICLMSLIAVIYLTYVQNGEAMTGYGFTGLFTVIFSVTGLILGVTTIKQKDRYKLFSVLGIVLNLLSLIAIALVVYVGLM